jgi:hypothetical protein
MDLLLNFSGGRMTGQGQDPVGGFVISGGYDAAGECRWTKIYPGSHTVDYRGFREGKGIWGTWKIDSHASGGFHIWPLDSDGVEEEAIESVEQNVPAEWVGIEQPGRVTLPTRSGAAGIHRADRSSSAIPSRRAKNHAVFGLMKMTSARSIHPLRMSRRNQPSPFFR